MKKKNVVIFFTDQQRSDSLGINGNPMGITPNLDLYAKKGTNCPLAFTPQPVCLPARACLQTGLYASQVNCNTNADFLPDDVPKLAEYFNDAGYHTGYIGKWHLHKTDQIVFKEPQGGYQYWLAENILEFESDAYKTSLHDGEGNKVNLPGYRVDALTDAAIRYIDDHKEEPFMLMLSHLEPHHQNHRDSYPAPTGYEQKYSDPWTPPDLKSLGGSANRHLPGYYGMIKRLDESYGRLMDTLKSLDLLDDTIVLYTADHGCHFKTRNSEYKRSCHDASINIPMVLSGGPFTGGGNISQLINLVDIPPTLLDACDIAVPKHMIGNSILPLLQYGKEAKWPSDSYTEISESHVGRCVRTKRWKFSIRQLQEGQFEEDFLYDLENDPWELDNLIGMTAYSKVTEILQSRLNSYLGKTGQQIPLITKAPSRESFQRAITYSECYE